MNTHTTHMTMEHMPALVMLDGALRVDSLHMDEHLLSRTDGLSGLDTDLLNTDEQVEHKKAAPCNS